MVAIYPRQRLGKMLLRKMYWLRMTSSLPRPVRAMLLGKRASSCCKS